MFMVSNKVQNSVIIKRTNLRSYFVICPSGMIMFSSSILFFFYKKPK